MARPPSVINELADENGTHYTEPARVKLLWRELCEGRPTMALPKRTAIVMTITPKIARDWLRRNGANRMIMPNLVRYLVHQINGGHWQVNGQTISFRKNGSLNDGQHRLLACVIADKPIESLVVFDLDNEAFRTVDTGRPRQPKDVLDLAGYKSPIVLAAAARWAMLELNNGLTTRSGGKIARNAPVTPSSVLDFVKAHPEMEDVAVEIDQHRGLSRLLSPSVAAYTAWRVRGIDPTKGDIFIEQVSQGDGLPKSSPAWQLRDRLIREMAQRKKADVLTRLALTIRAWNAYYTHRPMDRLMWDRTKSGFPKWAESPTAEADDAEAAQ